MLSPVFQFGGNIVSAVQLAIGPALLIVGLGSVLRVLSNRLSRLTDRVRKIEGAAAVAEGRTRALRRLELRSLIRSRVALYRAIALAAVAAFLVCLLILLIFLDDVLTLDLTTVTALLFVSAMVCLTGSLLLFLREISLAYWRFRLVVGRWLDGT